MRKKMISALLSGVLAVGMLAGCLPVSASATSSEEAVSSVAEAASAESLPDSAEETAPLTGDISKLKVGMILNVSHDDGGFNQAEYDAFQRSMKDLGLSDDQFIYVEGVSEETVATTNAVEQMVDNGCNMIIGGSTGYAPILNDLAKKYPDVQFVQVGVPADNLITYHIRAYDAMYVIGYLMAEMSDSDQLGYVAGMSEASVRFSVNGFALGAKAYNKNATVNLLWANSWYDPAAETECANTLIASGIKYIGAGTTSSGVAQACQSAGAFCTGYDVDHTAYAPQSVAASFVFNWTPIYDDIVTNYVNSDYKVTVKNYFWGAEHDCAQIVFNKDIIPDQALADAEKVQEDIASGKIDVYAGELKDNEGNVLVEEGKTMPDDEILNQEFLVDNVKGTWK